MPYVTKDSGERMEFETGSRRDTNKGKTRPGLIGPELKRRLGDLMARGADKYGDGNWRLGQKASRYLDSLERHLLQWEEGDDTEDHLAAIVFNVMGLMHLEKHMPEHLDHERYELAKTHPDNLMMQQHLVQMAGAKVPDDGKFFEPDRDQSYRFVDLMPITNPLVSRNTYSVTMESRISKDELDKTMAEIQKRIRTKMDDMLLNGADAPNIITGE